jgi:hypothetical protein
MTRREFLRLVGAVAGTVTVAPSPRAGTGGAGPDGIVAHILPTVRHDRMLIKVSFTAAQAEPPVLRVNRRQVQGQPTDTQGLFWAFDVDGLRAARRYTLDLRAAGRRALDPWTLSTFPDPATCPERFRLLVYTCAGGNDLFPLYVPLPLRQRLLRRALAFEPDAVLAIGDHVYWDLRAGLAARVTGDSALARERAGVFDRAAPVLGHPNEAVLKRAVDPQIAALYGTAFRGVPVFFLRDDHDYFEDDQVTEDLVTFPADPFMQRLARATQWLYYPELLPDAQRPPDLPGSCPDDRPRGVSEAFGTLRYGGLVEALLYDCKGFVSLAGAAGRVVPASVESWLTARMADPCPRYVVNVPSNPPGWSAGKFAEWYPDVVGGDGRLTTETPKPGWQEGWLAQHDRLLAAASAMARVPLFLSGDLHGATEGRILRSGARDFRANPVVSLVSGTPGTGVGWPSVARGTLATPPTALEVESVVPVEEVNGFHLVDFELERVAIRHFRWNRLRDPEDAIDTLAPFHASTYPRRGVGGA